jgi:molybdopterin synthase catalytic subunit
MTVKSKFESAINVGECIKAYDIMPRTGVECYVVGVVREIKVVDDVKVFLIDCVYDSFANNDFTRAGKQVKVPVELPKFEFDHRIQKV